MEAIAITILLLPLRNLVLLVAFLSYATQGARVTISRTKYTRPNSFEESSTPHGQGRCESSRELRPLGLLLLALHSNARTGHPVGFLHLTFVQSLDGLSRASLPALSDSTSLAPSEMRLKEIKEELDARSVKWRGLYFEKDELVEVLKEARASSPSPAEVDTNVRCTPEPPLDAENEASSSPSDIGNACCPPKSPSATTQDINVGSGSSDEPSVPDDAEKAARYNAAYSAAYENAMTMKIKELRIEIADRGGRWADCYEKTDLAARLAELVARAANFSASGALSPGKVTQVDAKELRQEMAEGQTPLLVDVFATWCGPCKMIAPLLEQVAKEGGERLRVVKMDTDAESQLSAELGVKAFPTVIFFQGGKETYRLEGVPESVDALKTLVANHAGVKL